jgi:Mg-chelatase subunit ChlD
MTDWIRRSFSATGLTQVPTGRHLRVLQDRFGGGTVMLCIDVSGSMDGRPILEAVRGALTFVDEAVETRYRVGVLLWNSDVAALAEPTEDGTAARRLLNRTKNAGGGTSLLRPLEKCHQILDRFKGDGQDRVVAIFGDGDLGPRERVLAKVAQMKAEDIRFVTRGLGSVAAHEFAAVSGEEQPSVAVSGVDDLAAGIAGMATSLKPVTMRREVPGR